MPLLGPLRVGGRKVFGGIADRSSAGKEEPGLSRGRKGSAVPGLHDLRLQTIEILRF